MAIIETIFDNAQDLTTHIVTNRLEYPQIFEVMKKSVETKRTSLVLWDFRGGQFLDMSGSEMKDVMKDLRTLAPTRGSGRTAMVVSSDADLGTGRMVETLLETEGFEVSVRFFRDMTEAREWLGLDA